MRRVNATIDGRIKSLAGILAQKSYNFLSFLSFHPLNGDAWSIAILPPESLCSEFTHGSHTIHNELFCIGLLFS
jgi:hypothetical protein